jgi:PAS domain S-box-containing protein
LLCPYVPWPDGVGCARGRIAVSVTDRGQNWAEDERTAHLAAVVDASSDAILSKTLAGTITSWNASAERIFGYTADEIVGANIRRLIPDDRQAEEDEILARLRRGEFIEHYETVRVAKDGSLIEVSLSISPVRDDAGRIVGASKIARDITARRQAEDALAAANAKFASVFNQSGIFAGILDTEGTVRDVNAMALEACGYALDEALDLPFWETPWWRDSEQAKASIRLAVRQASAGEAFAETLPYFLADGSERLVEFAMHPIVDDAGVVRFLHPTGIDVTDRAAAEAALLALEAEEREIAVGLQRALLPTRIVDRSDIALGALYEAGSDALEVGGDWFDIFELPDGRVAVTVGDVVGHGLAAAAAMGQVRTALAALAEHADGPAQLLVRLDGFLVRHRTTDFATLCYAAIDPATGLIEYASAGHPPMLIVSPAGEISWLDRAQSPPLTGTGNPNRPQGSALLEPGSLLLLYSDGLVERRKEPIDVGLRRLADAARTAADHPPEDVCRTLVAKLGVDDSRDDDVVVLAVRLAAMPSGRFHRRFPAHGEQLRDLRASMRGWLDERGVGQPLQQTLLLAVGEACANAIEHAYSDIEPSDVRVDMLQSDSGGFVVEVRDSGRFRAASASSTDRGRGTPIMRSLTTDFSRESTSAGTVVRFRVLSGEAFQHG